MRTKRNFIISIVLSVLMVFVLPFHAMASDSSRQTVSFQFDKLKKTPELVFESQEDQYFYELAVRNFKNGIYQFTLSQEDNEAIFHNSHVRIYDLYQAMYRINQVINSATLDYGFFRNSLFVMSYAPNDYTAYKSVTVYIEPNYCYEVTDADIDILKGVFHEANIQEGMDQKAAIVKINDFITDTFYYTTENVRMRVNVYEALKNRRGVCHDYANVFRFLTRMCGIESYYISGTTSQGLHAWNKTVINNMELYTDTTWNQSSCKWLLKTSDEFRDHVGEKIY